MAVTRPRTSPSFCNFQRTIYACYLYGNDLDGSCPHPCPSTAQAAGVDSWICDRTPVKATFECTNICSAGTEYVNTKTRTRSPRKKEAGLRLLELVESRGSATGYPLSGYRPGFTTACNFFRNFIIEIHIEFIIGRWKQPTINQSNRLGLLSFIEYPHS